MTPLTGESKRLTIRALKAATDEDLQKVKAFVGDADLKREDFAVVEAVAFDNTENTNGWKVADVSAIKCVGCPFTIDHSLKASDAFGTVFDEKTEEPAEDLQLKVVKACIPKYGNKEVLNDLRYKVASAVSPMLIPTKWADEQKQVVAEGDMVHLSLVQQPAFKNAHITSFAASVSDEEKGFAELGRMLHGENVTQAVRLAERRAGGFTKEDREACRAKYQSMSPTLLAGEVLPMLRELSGQAKGTTQKTLSAVTDDSTVKDVPSLPAQKRPAYPFYFNQKEKT